MSQRERMASLESTTDLQQILATPEIAACNQTFSKQLNSPCYTPCDRPSLCVMQGECATVISRGLQQLLIGSQDATTCIVAILACPVSSVVWAAHLDDYELGSDDVQELESALQQMQQPQLYMAGGYCEESGRGPRRAQAFLQLLHTLDPRIEVQLCCVGEANTAADGSPRCCQLVFDTQSWQPHPWLFSDRGPEVPRRFVAQHCRCDPNRSLLPIWDQQQQQLVLSAFEATITSWHVMRYERLLQLPGKQLLQYMSTSPDHEPEWFAQDMRNMMCWLLSAQEPDSPERQAASSTHRYRWSGSSWHLVQEPAAAAAAAAAAGGDS